MPSPSDPVPLSVALTPSDPGAVTDLISDITVGAEKWRNLESDVDETNRDAARHELLAKARALVQSLETPRETMIKHCWAQPGVIAALTCGVDKGLWTLMAKNGDRPQKVAELAHALDFDHALLSRLMRHLGSMGYLEETGPDEYKPTSFSKSMSIDIIGDGYFPMLVVGGPAQLEFVEFARKNGYGDDAFSDSSNTSAMHAHRTTQNFFELNEAKGYGSHFASHMGGYRLGRAPWMHPKFYPVQQRLIDGADVVNVDAPFLVDVGGSVGHDLVEFQRYHPQHPGKLILEDLPSVVAHVKGLDSRIQHVSHDFFKEQPIKHARAYYLHSVLHDWPDADCKKIVGKITASMLPGYSKLLINENVIPATDAHWEATGLDMVMLTFCSAKERTMNDWETLLQSCGVKIIKVWSVGKSVESLIECELA